MFAAEDIAHRLEQGQRPRNDGFFEREISPGRTAAQEILEGTLIAAQRAYQEKKVPYMGRLYSAIAFDSSLDISTANYLVHVADALTWTQYLILCVVAHNFGGELHLRDTMFPPEGQQGLIQLAHETLELAQRNYLLQKRPGEDHSELILDAPHIAPQYLSVQGMGWTLVKAAQLETIPVGEWAPVARAFGSPLE